MIYHEVLFRMNNLSYIIYRRVHQDEVLFEKNFKLSPKTQNYHHWDSVL